MFRQFSRPFYQSVFSMLDAGDYPWFLFSCDLVPGKYKVFHLIKCSYLCLNNFHRLQEIGNAVMPCVASAIFNVMILKYFTCMVSLFFLPPNGLKGSFPVATWYKVTPRLHKSTVTPNCFPIGRLKTALSYKSGCCKATFKNLYLRMYYYHWSDKMNFWC